jgi:hypothetical protein
MARGRPVVGVDLIDRMDGPRVLRRRVRIILATLSGTLPIAQACAELGVGRTRFHALRWQVLEGAIDALKPRARGRPRRVPHDAPEVLALRARIRELEVALRTTALRSEIALAMPHLLDRAGRKKKGAGRSTIRRSRA